MIVQPGGAVKGVQNAVGVQMQRRLAEAGPGLGIDGDDRPVHPGLPAVGGGEEMAGIGAGGGVVGVAGLQDGAVRCLHRPAAHSPTMEGPLARHDVGMAGQGGQIAVRGPAAPAIVAVPAVAAPEQVEVAGPLRASRQPEAQRAQCLSVGRRHRVPAKAGQQDTAVAQGEQAGVLVGRLRVGGQGDGLPQRFRIGAEPQQDGLRAGIEMVDMVEPGLSRPERSPAQPAMVARAPEGQQHRTVPPRGQRREGRVETRIAVQHAMFDTGHGHRLSPASPLP